MFERGCSPAQIRVGNRPEFISRALDYWAYITRVTLDFSRSGKPTHNAYPDSLNGRLRDNMPEHATVLVFGRRQEQDRGEAWRRDFNETRPHTSLRFMTLAEFASLAGVISGQ